jgi:hypothetical protein
VEVAIVNVANEKKKKKKKKKSSACNGSRHFIISLGLGEMAPCKPFNIFIRQGLDSSGRPAFVLYFRVRYYVDTPLLLR